MSATDLPPAFNFTAHPSVSAFAIPASDYISADPNPNPYYNAIATGSIVFSDNKVLLLQRASHDSMPLLWETPGGACDDEDASILHAAARELWEEAGLMTTRVMGVVGEGFCFGRRTGPQVKKFNFIMEFAEGDVKLSDEHAAFVWASEEEVREERVGDLKVPITKPEQKDVVLRAFEVRRKMREG